MTGLPDLPNTETKLSKKSRQVTKVSEDSLMIIKRVSIILKLLTKEEIKEALFPDSVVTSTLSSLVPYSSSDEDSVPPSKLDDIVICYTLKNEKYIQITRYRFTKIQAAEKENKKNSSPQYDMIPFLQK